MDPPKALSKKRAVSARKGYMGFSIQNSEQKPITTGKGVERKKESEVTQSCPTLCNRMDCSLPGSSIHGIFQARVLEWVAISFSKGSS